MGETGLISCQITKPQTKKLPSGASIEITSNNDILELYPKGNLSCDFIAKGIQDDGQTINNQVVVLVTVNVKDKNGCLLRSKNICIVILEPTGLVFTLINRRNNTEQEKFLNEYIKLGGPFPNIYPSYRNKAQILGYPVIGRYGASFFASISLTPQDVSFNNLNIFENSCSSLVSGCFTGHNLNHPRTPESNYFTISSIQSGNTITGDIGITGDFVLIAMADYEYKEKYDINKKTGKFLWNIPCLYKTQHDSFAATYLIIEQKGEFKVNNQGYIETSTTKESSATRVLPPPPNNL